MKRLVWTIILLVVFIELFCIFGCSNNEIEQQKCGTVKSTVSRIKSDGSTLVSAVDFGNGFVQITKNNPTTINNGTYYCVE